MVRIDYVDKINRIKHRNRMVRIDCVDKINRIKHRNRMVRIYSNLLADLWVRARKSMF
jgi:hypothetical protein